MAKAPVLGHRLHFEPSNEHSFHTYFVNKLEIRSNLIVRFKPLARLVIYHDAIGLELKMGIQYPL